MNGPKLRMRPTTDDAWKEGAACREVVRGYVRAGWSYQRAQQYVTGLYYQPGDGVKPGRQPAGGRTAEEDPFYLPRLWCRDCIVAARCIEDAVTTDDTHGFRAGFTPKELERIVKIRRRQQLRERLGVQPLPSIVSSGRR